MPFGAVSGSDARGMNDVIHPWVRFPDRARKVSTWPRRTFPIQGLATISDEGFLSAVETLEVASEI